MAISSGSEVVCPVCNLSRRSNEIAPGASLREPIVVEVRRQHPTWSIQQPICFACLNRYRVEHVRRLLEEEKGDLSALEVQVIESLREQDSVSANVNQQFEGQLSFGQRLSDRMAGFGGSWFFLILFAVVVILWMFVNTIAVVRQPFDPYPFILLNLVLSCLAAVQAPIILMSQKRQEAKDRLRSEHDYRVNLKAEIEVRLLHAKLDQLLAHQWQRLLEIQELQVEIMEEVADARTSQPETTPPETLPPETLPPESLPPESTGPATTGP